MPMKQENLELVIVDYPRNLLYWKLNYKQRWSSSAFLSVPNMFVKVVGITAIFDESQLLAGYHWHFHAYPMILSVNATDYCLNFENKRAHTHTRALEIIYSIIFQLYEIFKNVHMVSKVYVVPCISNHYIRIKIQDIFWNAWPQRIILFQQGLFWLIKPVKFLSGLNFHYILLL